MLDCPLFVAPVNHTVCPHTPYQDKHHSLLITVQHQFRRQKLQ